MNVHVELRANWRIILSCFIGLSVSASPGFLNVFGLFLTGYEHRYGWSRGAISLGPVVTSLTAGLLTPFIGTILDRYGPRWVVLAGCAIFPLALLSFGIIRLDYQRFLSFALFVGVAASVVAPSTYLNLLAKYFEQRLGVAISLAILGLGAGQMILPLAAQSFISIYGLDGAWVALASLVAIVGVANALLIIRRQPSAEKRDVIFSEADRNGHTFRQTIAEPVYWQLCVAFLLVVMVTSALSLHFPAILADRGFTVVSGAAAVALIGFGSILARLATGLMLDRVHPCFPACLFFGGQKLACLLIWSGLPAPTPYFAALLIGGALGAEGDLMPFVLKRIFGLRAFGRNYGLCFGLFQLGAVAGAFAIGRAYDKFGSYQAALIGFSITTALAVLLFIRATIGKSFKPALALTIQ